MRHWSSLVKVFAPGGEATFTTSQYKGLCPVVSNAPGDGGESKTQPWAMDGIWQACETTEYL